LGLVLYAPFHCSTPRQGRDTASCALAKTNSVPPPPHFRPPRRARTGDPGCRVRFCANVVPSRLKTCSPTSFSVLSRVSSGLRPTEIIHGDHGETLWKSKLRALCVLRGERFSTERPAQPPPKRNGNLTAPKSHNSAGESALLRLQSGESVISNQLGTGSGSPVVISGKSSSFATRV